MPGKETARQHRTLAQDQYKRGQYVEAMQSADKALALGFLDISVYDIKAAALNKLVEPEDGPWRDLGIETIKIMCQKWPGNWRPYYRKAEYLRSRGSFNLALGAISRSLELAENGSHDLIIRKRTEIEGLREIDQIKKERRISMATGEDRQTLIKAQRIEAKKTQDFTHLLSPDILDLVVDHLIVDNPSIACRIGGVRRSWRSWMLARPGAWQTLEVGSTRPIEKAKAFIERGGGILRSFRILETFPSNLETRLAEILSGHIGNIKTLAYTGYPSQLVRDLSGQFNSLEEIVESPSHHPKSRQIIQTSGNQLNTGVDRGLKITKSSLKSVTLINGQVTLSSDSVASRKLQSFQMHGGALNSAEGSLVEVVKCMPDLVEIALENVSHSITGLPLGQVEATLDRLKSFSVSSTPLEAPDSSNVILDFFVKVHTPNLLRLRVYRYSQDLTTLFLAPGLAPCLSGLQALDIGHTTIDEAALVGNLKNMNQLRFLNISSTTLNDTFLRAITYEGKDKSLLPNLTALSMAALDVTSLALRDFAISRLPKSSRIHLAPPGQPEIKSSPAFRPSTTTSKRPTSVSGSPPDMASSAISNEKPPKTHLAHPTTPGINRSAALRPSSSASKPSSQTLSAPASTANTRSNRESPRRFLKWLCLDHCETIDHQLIEYLRTKILFVSAGKARNEERIRGLGRYQWDLNYYDSCLADDPKERCKLVAIPGTRDGYEIHHTCGKYDHQDQSPREAQDNIWESQWDPSSSQDAENDVGQKRMLPSDASGSSRRAKKVKGKGRISIGPDGSLSGF